MRPAPGSPADADYPLPALLALVQAAALVDLVATTGAADEAALDHLNACLLGDVTPCREADYPIGREVLLDFLRGELPDERRTIPGYIKDMLRLARLLERRPALRTDLRQRLAELGQRRRDFGELARVGPALAAIHADTLGRLRPRLAVTGTYAQVINRHNGELIRTAILAGVQAAGLWRAAGGRWWHLRLRRRAFLRVML